MGFVAQVACVEQNIFGRLDVAEKETGTERGRWRKTFKFKFRFMLMEVLT